jgi:hypothetical protein
VQKLIVLNKITKGIGTGSTGDTDTEMYHQKFIRLCCVALAWSSSLPSTTKSHSTVEWSNKSMVLDCNFRNKMMVVTQDEGFSGPTVMWTSSLLWCARTSSYPLNILYQNQIQTTSSNTYYVLHYHVLSKKIIKFKLPKVTLKCISSSQFIKK